MSSRSVQNSRMTLPNISTTPQISYTQRYEHMTKLANYSQMNQGQIWKQYQKLRTCLKQINQQVLYQMQRKAYSNINNKQQKQKINKDSQTTLIMFEDQKKTNQIRYSNFYNQLSKLEERVNFLSGKHNYLESMTVQIEGLMLKIKQTKKDNKDIKRKAKIVGNNIVNCTSALDRLVMQQDRLNRAYIRHRRFKQYFQSLQHKQIRYKQFIKQTDEAIDNRLKQFSSQQNFIQQQIHYERYQQLKKQKQNLLKYQTVYKRNYLIKLRQLQNLVNSLTKQDKIIQQNQSNIINLRNQIDSVLQIVQNTKAAPVKKRSASTVLQSSNTIRIRSKQNQKRQSKNISNRDISISIDTKDRKLIQQEQGVRTARRKLAQYLSNNDKNQSITIQK